MSCFHVSVQLRVSSSRVLSRLRALFHVGAWCSDPGTRVLSFGFVSGSDTRAPCSVSLCECAVSSSLGSALFCLHVFCGVARSSCFYRLRAFILCLVLWDTQLVYTLAACVHVVMSCVNMWLMSFFVAVRVLFCTWLVICLLAMCLCFCFV